MKKDMRSDIDYAIQYLSDGGMGEVIGFADIAVQMDQPKVQMDTAMALALCELASETITRRQSH